MKKVLLVFATVCFFTSVSFAQTQVIGQSNTSSPKEEQKPIEIKSSSKTIHKTEDRALIQKEFLLKKKAKYLHYADLSFVKTNNIPSSFPKFIDTKDNFEDTKNFDIALDKWIEENEIEYKRLKLVLNVLDK